MGWWAKKKQKNAKFSQKVQPQKAFLDQLKFNKLKKAWDHPEFSD